MVSLRARESGNWQARCYIGRRGGKPAQRSKSFPGLLSEREAMAAAERWARNLRGHAGAGGGMAGAMTLGEYLAEYVELKVEPVLSPATARQYRFYAAAYVSHELEHRPLADVHPVDVQRLYAELLRRRELSRSTVASFDTFLHGAFAHAVAQGYIDVNPMAGVSAPHAETAEAESLDFETAAWVRAELERVFDIGSVAALIALGTGLRRGEVCGLVWANFDADGTTLRVATQIVHGTGGLARKRPKSASGRRTVTLSGRDTAWLRSWRVRQRDMLAALDVEQTATTPVVSVTGGVTSPNDLDRAWAETRERLGLPDTVGFHALRHTHVAMCLANGVDIMTVSHRLGHSKASTTLDLYGHMMPGSDSAAADALEMAMKWDGDEGELV